MKVRSRSSKKIAPKKKERGKLNLFLTHVRRFQLWQKTMSTTIIHLYINKFRVTLSWPCVMCLSYYAWCCWLCAQHTKKTQNNGRKKWTEIISYGWASLIKNKPTFANYVKYIFHVQVLFFHLYLQWVQPSPPPLFPASIRILFKLYVQDCYSLRSFVKWFERRLWQNWSSWLWRVKCYSTTMKKDPVFLWIGLVPFNQLWSLPYHQQCSSELFYTSVFLPAVAVFCRRENSLIYPFFLSNLWTSRNHISFYNIFNNDLV